MERDDEVNKRLLFEDWTVIRFWGTDIEKRVDECVQVIEEVIFDNNLANNIYLAHAPPLCYNGTVMENSVCCSET